MADFIFCANAILPSFCLIAIGYCVKRIGLVNSVGISQFNKVLFFLLMPMITFENTYTSDLSHDFDLRVVSIAFFCVLFSFFLMLLIAPKLTDDRAAIGSMIQGSFRSNAVAFGLPIAINFCGPTASGPTAVLCTAMVPLYNIMAVTTFSIYNKKSKKRPDVIKIAKKILTNPLVISFIAGMVIQILHLQLPVVFTKTVSSLSRAGSTMALVVIGMQLDFKNAANNIKLSSAVALVRLIITPAIALTASVMLGLRGPLLCAPLFILAAPCATGCASLAEAMDGDGDLAAEMVVFTTALSIFTLFIYSFILKSWGLI